MGLLVLDVLLEVRVQGRVLLYVETLPAQESQEQVLIGASY